MCARLCNAIATDRGAKNLQFSPLCIKADFAFASAPSKFLACEATGTCTGCVCVCECQIALRSSAVRAHGCVCLCFERVSAYVCVFSPRLRVSVF